MGTKTLILHCINYLFAVAMHHILVPLVTGDGGEILVTLVASVQNLSLLVDGLAMTLQIVIVLQIFVANLACEDSNGNQFL